MNRSIVILKKYPDHNREVNLIVTDLSMPGSGSLSELELDSVNEIVSELTTLISSNDPGSYYEWGVDLFSVLSGPVTSSCRNEAEGTELPDVSTRSLLDLMKELQHFKEQYRNMATLQAVAEQAFAQIKTSPSGYRKWPDASYYEISVGDITVSLNLSDDDLKLTIAGFLDQLGGN